MGRRKLHLISFLARGFLSLTHILTKELSNASSHRHHQEVFSSLFFTVLFLFMPLKSPRFDLASKGLHLSIPSRLLTVFLYFACLLPQNLVWRDQYEILRALTPHRTNRSLLICLVNQATV